jgi:hypothetical protein
MTQQSLIPTFSRRGNQFFVADRLAGWLTRDSQDELLFVSARNRAEHYFRIFRGWGISAELLTHLKTLNVAFIILKINNAETLRSTPEEWLRLGRPYQRRPFERQLIIPERLMEKLAS